MPGIVVRQTLLAAGFPDRYVAEMSDAVYMPCLSTWLCGDFHRWYFRALQAFDIEDFEAERGDCDDKTDLFCTLARIAHRRTPEGKGTGLPLGRVNYLRVPHAAPGPAQDKHVLAWAITRDKGLIYPEPQVLYRIEKLTVPQIQSATRVTD